MSGRTDRLGLQCEPDDAGVGEGYVQVVTFEDEAPHASPREQLDAPAALQEKSQKVIEKVAFAVLEIAHVSKP